MGIYLKRGKILFIDDQEDAVKPYVQHLKDEGFTNVELISDVKSLDQVIRTDADLVFLDITGVATALDGNEEGLTVLEYLKKHCAWTRVVVLSGSDFPASKAKPLSQADLCITKASLTLADLVNLTEDQLTYALSPEYRNVKIMNMLASRLDEVNLNWWRRHQLKKLIAIAREHEGDASYDWQSFARSARKTLSVAANVATVVSALVS